MPTILTAMAMTQMVTPAFRVQLITFFIQSGKTYSKTVMSTLLYRLVWG